MFNILNYDYHQVARETNEELRAIQADPAEGFDVGAILTIARRLFSALYLKNLLLRMRTC